MFDEETRDAIAANTTGFGDAFAGRGESINTAIGAFRPLLRDIVPVAQNLASPETNLRRFFGELGDAAAIVAPAAEAQAELFVNLDTTFRALREVARPYIQDSITGGVPGARHRDPHAADPAAVPAQHRGPVPRAAAGRRRAAPVRADDRRRARGGHRARCRARRPSTAASRRCSTSSQTFAEDPQVPSGPAAPRPPRSQSLNPTLAFITPAQTVCNYLTLWFRNVSSLLSVGDRNGTWQRFIIVATPQGPNNEGGPSSAPANGPTEDNHLHTNPYPNTAAPGQPRECEAGNEPYARGPHGARRTRPARSRRARRATPDGAAAALSPVTIGLIALAVIVAISSSSASPRTSRSPSRTRSTPSSSRRTRSGPARRCGSPASTSARSRRSRPTRTPTRAVVVLQIDDDGLPLHEDATAKIRPRIFLEGNFFVDLKPGSPRVARARGRRHDQGHADRHAGAARPGADRRCSPTRGRTSRTCSTASTWRSTRSRRRPRTATADPSTRGETAAESFNDAYDDIPDAERSTAQVLEAFLGTEPDRDLSRLIDGTARTTGALIRNENALRGLITNFNTTMAAFAAESGNLRTLDPRAAAHARERQPRARLAQRGVPVHARVRARDHPRRPRDAGHDRGGVAVDRPGAPADGPEGARRRGEGARARPARTSRG